MNKKETKIKKIEKQTNEKKIQKTKREREREQWGYLDKFGGRQGKEAVGGCGVWG